MSTTALHIRSHLHLTPACVAGMTAILKGAEMKAQKISNHLKEFAKLIDDTKWAYFQSPGSFHDTTLQVLLDGVKTQFSSPLLDMHIHFLRNVGHVSEVLLL